ncbi:hypothetical protein JW887_05075 [Candidatus Dojkabacteria bacterium]|nr:hypothetical protein [Candidatus Dojkabacteria bacterium]
MNATKKNKKFPFSIFSVVLILFAVCCFILFYIIATNNFRGSTIPFSSPNSSPISMKNSINTIFHKLGKVKESDEELELMKELHGLVYENNMSNTSSYNLSMILLYYDKDENLIPESEAYENDDMKVKISISAESRSDNKELWALFIVYAPVENSNLMLLTYE